MNKKIAFILTTILILIFSFSFLIYENTKEVEYIEEYVTKNEEKQSKEVEVYYTVYEIININTASKEKIMTLKGISDKIADNIILYRENVGKFNTIEDIMNVKGIGIKKFKNIKKYIEV